MTRFEWTGAIELGHEAIDGQHRRMLWLAEAFVQSLIDAAESGPVSAQLQALIDYSREHFAFEEDLMRSSDYPGAERHEKYHASLMAELSTHCSRLRRGQDTNPAALMSFLWDWMVVHIDSLDRELVVWLKLRESGGTVQVETGAAVQEEGMRAQQERSELTPQSPDPAQPATRTLSEIETMALAARAAWLHADEVRRTTGSENRALHADLKTAVDHHTKALTQLEARFEQSEHRTHDLLHEFDRLTAGYQDVVSVFNGTTRKIALAAVAMMLILFTVLEISWWGS